MLDKEQINQSKTNKTKSTKLQQLKKKQQQQQQTDKTITTHTPMHMESNIVMTLHIQQIAQEKKDMNE